MYRMKNGNQVEQYSTNDKNRSTSVKHSPKN